MGIPAAGSIRAFRTLRDDRTASGPAPTPQTLSVHRRLEELAELVGGIAGDYHTLLATVLADAEPAVGEFPAGTRPTKTVRESRCCTSHHTRVYDQVGQDYFDVLG